jgi:hypothetical protein
MASPGLDGFAIGSQVNEKDLDFDVEVFCVDCVMTKTDIQH